MGIAVSVPVEGEALDSYAQLGVGELNDYVVIMKAILKRYNLTGRTYNDMLRTSKQNRNKTLRDFIIRSLCYFEH